MKSTLLLVAVLIGLITPAAAEEFKVGALTIDNPWARASTGPVAGAFLTIQNSGDADRLVAIGSDAASQVQVHVTEKQGDVMKMRAVDAVDVPAHGSVALQPGGMHIMLIGLKGPLQAGAQVPLTLRFEKAGEVHLTATVQAPGAMAPMGGGMMDHQHMMDHSHQ